MGSAENSQRELSLAEYWDSRYNKGDELVVRHEWFRNFVQLETFLIEHLPSPTTNPRILQLGCGTSEITSSLYNLGYHNQTNIDFAAKAIELMRDKHTDLHDVKWEVMDVRKITFESCTFDIAFDKGTLDSMLYGSLWTLEDEVVQNTSAYVDEVLRVLKPGGLWLYVTFRQSHFLRPILQRNGWDCSVKILGGEDGTFEYFGWVIQKL